MMELTDWSNSEERVAWLKHVITNVLRQTGSPLTVSKIAWQANGVSNPARRKRKGEYKFTWTEVETTLKVMVKDLVLVEDRERRKYDPKSAWPKRYWFMGLLEAIATAADEA